MLVGEAFRPGDVFHVLRRFLLVAGPADRRQAIWIVCFVACVAQRKGRAVIENDEADDEPCPAVGTAPLLAQHDLGADPPRDRAPLRAEEWPSALHAAVKALPSAGRAVGGWPSK